jgi:xylulokinase
MKTLLSIDLGVTFVKSGLYDTDGTCICDVKRKSPGEHQGTDIFIQKAYDYFDVVLQTIRDIVNQKPEKVKKIAAISFSGLMAGAVGIDDYWNDITTCSSNMDPRYTPYVEDMIAENRSGMSSLCGTNYPYWGAKLLWWKNEYPDLYGKVKKFVFLGGYIAGKMCGLTIDEAFTDRSYLVMTGLADVRNNRWSKELCDSFGINIDVLPKICSSTDIVGHVNKETAGMCGLQEGIPVTAGAGDKPAGALGSGLVEPGMLVDESASFGAFSLCIDRFIPDTQYGTVELIASPIDGLYYPTSFLLGSGITLSWFLKMITGQEEPGEDTFSVLEKEAVLLPPGSEGLLSVGLLDGRAYPCDPAIRGMWLGHSWTHGRAHFYRSLLESYAYEFNFFLQFFKQMYNYGYDEVRAIGGGAESDLWCQIKTDVLGVPYCRTNRSDHALLGNIIIAGSASGVYPDVASAAKRFCSTQDRFTVNEETHAAYQTIYPLYLEAIERNRDLFPTIKKSCV